LITLLFPNPEHSMRKILTLYFTPVVGAILILIKVPQIEVWLKSKSPHAEWYLGGILALGVIVTHVITIISPFKKYEKLEKDKWLFLNYLFKQFVRDQGLEPYHFSMNVMIIKRKIIHNLEPRKGIQSEETDRRRLRFFGRVFAFAWKSTHTSINKKLKISINQGACGKSFREGRAIWHNFEERKKFNLNKEQLDATRDLKILFCCPLFKDDEVYTGQSSDEVIGILNLESVSENSVALFGDKAKRENLSNEIIALSNICNKLL
jgi:hypothetical protein